MFQFLQIFGIFLKIAKKFRSSAVIWGKLACPSERVQRERDSACALNGHASFSQITADVA